LARATARQLLTGGDGGGQGGNHGVAGTGDIEHFTGPRRQVQRRMARAQQGHAVFATGHQQAPRSSSASRVRPLATSSASSAAADDGLELAEVRRDQAGATVDGEVLALGIGQHRNAAFARGLDQRLVVLQRALAVVGEHQHLDLRAAPRPRRPARRRRWRRFFEIDAQQLLVTAHDPQLDDGRLMRRCAGSERHAGRLQAVGQAAGSLVLAGDADQRRPARRGGNVQRDVGGAARTVLDADRP
jgi:hypothetical protein